VRYPEAEKVLAEVHANGPVAVEVSPSEGKPEVLAMPNQAEVNVLDVVLANSKLPPIAEMLGRINGATDNLLTEQLKAAALDDKVNVLAADLKTKEEEFKEQLITLDNQLKAKPFENQTVVPNGDIPEGTLVMKPLGEVFTTLKGLSKEEKAMEIPCWEWVDSEGAEVVHSDVPQVDSKYIFRKKELLRVIYAILSNQRCYLQGDTGTGKTTLIEQVGAAMGWPVPRVNFDSEITRMDLIGRDVLTTDEDGNTISTFVDGILPRMMSSPCLATFDEIDFVRPDVAYVMQAALEGNGLRITEDGDRLVKPHEMFRMFATGNTVGQGDEKGMYQGARPQSMALLDRFTIWVHVDYLLEDERLKLLTDTVPTLTGDEAKKVGQYVTEHLEAFREAKVMQPISPRGLLAIGKATQYFKSMGSKNPVKEALGMTILDRANIQDRAVLHGLVNRVVK